MPPRRPSPLPSIVAIVGLGLGPVHPALAAGPAGPDAAAEEASAEAGDETAPGADADDGALAEAKRLYEEGKAHYEMLDYPAAIDKWTKAYALVPESERGRAVRNALVYNIAQAQEKAYDLDGDVTHLKQAKGLLERYLESYVEIYGEEDEAAEEVQKVRDRIAELDERIAANARGAGPSARERRRAARAAERKRRAMALELLQKDPKLHARYKKAKGLVAGGAALLGGGFLVTFAGVALVSAAREGRIEPRAERAGTVIGVIGLTSMVAGAVLLPIGAVRAKKVRREALDRVTVTPVAGRGFGGIALAGRF